MTMTADEIAAELSGFYGTEAYHKFNLFAPVLLTDGAAFLAKEAGCFWLMDIIASAVTHYRDNGFAVVRFDCADGAGVVTIENGNGRVLYTQEIEHTDFPMDRADLFVAPADERTWVIMLPSEY
jgi:hypothetical protein